MTSSSVYSFEIINVVITDPEVFFWIAVSVADAAVVNPNGITERFKYIFIKDKPLLSNGPRSFVRNPPDLFHFIKLSSWSSYISWWIICKGFAKPRDLCISTLVSNNLCWKLVSSSELPITFDEIFKVTSVPFFIPDYNLVSW